MAKREFGKFTVLNKLYLRLDKDLGLKEKLLNIYGRCENKDLSEISYVQGYWLHKLLTPKMLTLINTPQGKRNVIAFKKKNKMVI